MNKKIFLPLMIGLLFVFAGISLGAAASDLPDQSTADPTLGGYGAELVSQQGGMFASAQYSGNYLYVPQGQRLSVFRFGSSNKIDLVGQSEVMSGPSDALEISGNYAFLADPGVTGYSVGSRLHVMDISNPAMPFEAVYLENLSSKAWDIELYNGYAFLANNSKGLWVVDVRDPLHPLHVTNRSVPEGAIYKVKVAHHASSGKTYAYLVANQHLVVVDITNPALPVKVSSLQNDLGLGGFLYIALNNNRAYLTDDSGVLHVIDISDPLHPNEIAATTPGTDQYYGPVGIGYNKLVVKVSDMSLKILDIASGGLPTNLGEYPENLNWCDIIMLADPTKVLLVSDSNLQVLNIANPASPILERSIQQKGHVSSVVRSGNLLFITSSMVDPDSLDVYNAIDPSNPVLLGSLPINGRIGDLSNGYLFLLQDWDYSIDPPLPGGMAIVDVHDPANLFVTDVITSTGRPYDVEIHGQNAYYVASGTGLQIFDITNPSNIQVINQYQADVSAIVAVSVGEPANQPGKTYAYIKTTSGVKILDVSDTQSITVTGNLDGFGGSLTTLYTPPPTNASIPAAGYYLAVGGGVTGAGGVDLFDVSNPSSPVYVDGFSLAEKVLSLEAQDGIVYAATGLKGINMLDFDGSNFHYLGSYFLPERVFDMAVAGDFIHLATGSEGLFNIWFGPPSYEYLPTSGGVLTSTFHNTTLTFPAGSFTDTVDLNYHPRYQGNMPAQFGLLGVGVYIELHPWRQNSLLTPATPYQFTWRYDDSLLNGADETSLALYSWNGSDWVKELSSSVDTTNNVLTAECQNIDRLAVLGGGAVKLFLPVTHR